jgi:hypothetical protein
METRVILQTIGMEAAVLAFLFCAAYAAIRISIAERSSLSRQDESLVPSSGETQLL